MVAAVATAIAPIFGAASTTVATVGLYAATTAASYFVQQATAPKPESGTKLQASFGGATAQSIIIGEKETAGHWIYAGSWGRPNKTPNGYYVRVYVLSAVRVTGFKSTVWRDNVKDSLDETASSGIVNGKTFGKPVVGLKDGDEPQAWIKFLDGTQTVADDYLVEVFGGLASRPWTAAMIGRGRPMMIVTERYNKKAPSSTHNFTAVPQGMPLYDWRKDSTNGGSGSHRWGDESTYEYSANPFVAAYNIKRGIYRGSEWLYGGRNWPARRFDNDSWTAAANVCDENVTLANGSTEKRCRVGMEFNLSEEPLTVIERILSACNGRLVESGGIYKVYAGAIPAAVVSITDDDIVISQGVSGDMFPGRESVYNSVTGSYCEPENGGQMKAFKRRTNADQLAADNGQIRAIEMTLDYCRSNTQAQRVARFAVNDNLRLVKHVIPLPAWARKLEPGDVINWNSTRLGYVNKKFIAGDVTLGNDGIVWLAIREANPNDSDWTVGDEDPYTVGVYGDIVPSSQTFAATVSAINIRNNAGTPRRPGIRIAATVDADDVDCKALKYRVRLKDTGTIIAKGRDDDFFDEFGANTIDIAHAAFLPGEDYQVIYKVIPYSDRATGWSAWGAGNVTLTNVPFARQDIAQGAIGNAEIDTDAVTTGNIRKNQISQKQAMTGSAGGSFTNAAKHSGDDFVIQMNGAKSINNENGSLILVDVDITLAAFYSYPGASGPISRYAEGTLTLYRQDAGSTKQTPIRSWKVDAVSKQKKNTYSSNHTLHIKETFAGGDASVATVRYFLKLKWKCQCTMGSSGVSANAKMQVYWNRR
ncbi:hypothetical protein JJB09_18630 [Rhizobium sp. KVB221]|uniref:Tip attachment protein J domain-containing protein n=1 Tax=Rhizobium setariae TaxID=2801340 RepID=A0A936YV26_9HYPH|nr:phage tail protein [Rhizobium setariae]MBL0374041.1 hypothetical protein [Rhizobium setariae]